MCVCEWERVSLPSCLRACICVLSFVFLLVLFSGLEFLCLRACLLTCVFLCVCVPMCACMCAFLHALVCVYICVCEYAYE